MTDLTIYRPDGGDQILFDHKELCDNENKGQLGQGFAAKLAMLRLYYGKPMIVNSCCRSKYHNWTIGGHERSLHVWDHPFRPTGGTIAIDISGLDIDLVMKAIKEGWSVGIYSNFVHLDRRDFANLPQRIFRGAT